MWQQHYHSRLISLYTLGVYDDAYASHLSLSYTPNLDLPRNSNSEEAMKVDFMADIKTYTNLLPLSDEVQSLFHSVRYSRLDEDGAFISRAPVGESQTAPSRYWQPQVMTASVLPSVSLQTGCVN